MKRFLLALLLISGTVYASSFGSNSFTSGPALVPPAAQTIAATDVITADACGTMKQITSAGAVTTNTTNTFTAPSSAPSGCLMFVCNTGSQNITLDNNANFKSAAGGDVIMTGNDCVTVANNGSAWYQATALVAN